MAYRYLSIQKHNKVLQKNAQALLLHNFALVDVLPLARWSIFYFFASLFDKKQHALKLFRWLAV